jgi:hypothetical protein
MRLGGLTIPVEVSRATVTGTDDYGHSEVSYSVVYSPLMVAVAEAPQTMVDGDADGRSRRTVAKFTAAWVPGLSIQPRDRVEWDGETYEVETFFNKLGLNKYAEFTAVRLDRG